MYDKTLPQRPKSQSTAFKFQNFNQVSKLKNDNRKTLDLVVSTLLCEMYATMVVGRKKVALCVAISVKALTFNSELWDKMK